VFPAVEDYPRDLLELEHRFSTEAACREYLFQLRWPGGFCCPRCGGRKAWPASDLLWECAGCHRQVSVTSGTIFQDSRLPLTLWFRNDKTASELMPRVHRVAALLKRWLLGTHQGGVSVEHLDAYLDEFTFRFNRRKSRSRGKLFYRLLEQAVAVKPVPYKSLVKCAMAANPDF
jgi:hypothetical protein